MFRKVKFHNSGGHFVIIRETRFKYESALKTPPAIFLQLSFEKSIFIKIVQHGVCLGSASKQNVLSFKKSAPKNALMTSIPRIGSAIMFLEQLWDHSLLIIIIIIIIII